MTELLQLIINGLVTGSILSLGAIGITLVLSTLGIGNFAHGDYMTIGIYAAFTVDVALNGGIALAFLAAALTTAAFAVAFDIVLLRRFRDKGPDTMMIVTLGLALIIRYTVYIIEGPNPDAFNVNVIRVVSFAGVRLAVPELFEIIIATVALIAVGLFLSKSTIGKSMRAISDNRELAAISGIDVRRFRAYIWIFSSMLAGLAGCLQALVQADFDPQTGPNILFLLFTAAVLGGVGSAYGTLVGGLVLGIAMQVSAWSALFGGLPPIYQPVVGFGVLLLLLLIRPQGLLGTARFR